MYLICVALVWCLARCLSVLCGICVCTHACVAVLTWACGYGGRRSIVSCIALLYRHFILVFETGALTELSLPFQRVWLARELPGLTALCPTPIPSAGVQTYAAGPIVPPGNWNTHPYWCSR